MVPYLYLYGIKIPARKPIVTHIRRHSELNQPIRHLKGINLVSAQYLQTPKRETLCHKRAVLGDFWPPKLTEGRIPKTGDRIPITGDDPSQLFPFRETPKPKMRDPNTHFGRRQSPKRETQPRQKRALNPYGA